MMRIGRRSRGFTLIELMIVVIIIGVIASLAIPRFMNTTARSKQSEAQGILKQIYTQERCYYQEHGTYTIDIAALGVEIMASSWYIYSIALNGNGTAFTAQANAPNPGIDDDPTPDIWAVDGSGVIVCVSNDVLN